MIIDLILLGIINSLFIWGINCLFEDGFLLAGVGKVLRKTFGSIICRPLFDCPPCQSSVWGVTFYVIAYDLTWIVIPYCICLCGLNFIIKEILYE